MLLLFMRSGQEREVRCGSQGFAAKYAKEYVEDTVGTEAPVVGEFWADLNWNGSNLDGNQDGARQALINYLDSAGGLFSMFDFPTKGILQVRASARRARSTYRGAPPHYDRPAVRVRDR